MSSRNFKSFLEGRSAKLFLAGGILLCSFLVFASTGPHTKKIKAVEVRREHTAQTSAPTQRGKQTRPVESEIITVTPRGFEPAAITRPRGEFILMIDNPSRQELNFTLTRENGASVHHVRASREEPNWNELEDLPPGEYVLTEETHPEWRCDITITAN